MATLWGRRRHLLKESTPGQLANFEEFTALSKRERIPELDGEPVHPMVLEGDSRNPFDIETAIDNKGEIITKSEITDEELKKKRERWLRPLAESSER